MELEKLNLLKMSGHAMGEIIFLCKQILLDLFKSYLSIDWAKSSLCLWREIRMDCMYK